MDRLSARKNTTFFLQNIEGQMNVCHVCGNHAELDRGEDTICRRCCPHDEFVILADGIVCSDCGWQRDGETEAVENVSVDVHP